MILALLTLLTAVAISAVAAYFSIVGLVAIFASAPISIAVMGSVLEMAKLITASWVYRNWTTAPKTILYYLTGSVVVLSLITSMGIFGYLSKAHIEQTTNAGPIAIQVKVLEQREATAKQRIDFLLSQEQKTTTASSRINRDLVQAQNELKAILEEKIPLLQEKNKLDAEIGPLKYITEFIYGDSDEALLNKAVRWVIITLIFVFDPLAILLLIAANISLNTPNQQTRPPITIRTEDGQEYVVQDGDEVVINLEEDVTPEEEPVKKEGWSKELFKRVSSPDVVNVEKSRIHSIPKEILEKVFKK